MRIGLCSVILQLRIIDDDDTVRAILAELIRQSADAGTNEHSRDLRIKVSCQFLSLSDKFQRNAGELAVNLLGKDEYPFILFLICCCHFMTPYSP